MDAEHTVAPSVDRGNLRVLATDRFDRHEMGEGRRLDAGTASIVRDAVISIENGPVLALWQPGNDIDGRAKRCGLPAGARLEDPSADSLQEAL